MLFSRFLNVFFDVSSIILFTPLRASYDCSLKPRELLLTTPHEGEKSGGAVGVGYGTAVGVGLREGMRGKESEREAIGF